MISINEQTKYLVGPVITLLVCAYIVVQDPYGVFNERWVMLTAATLLAVYLLAINLIMIVKRKGKSINYIVATLGAGLLLFYLLTN